METNPVPVHRQTSLAYHQKIILNANLLYTVRVPGVEPGTSSLSVTRSNHLSYTRTLYNILKIFNLRIEKSAREQTYLFTFIENYTRIMCSREI